MNVHVRLFTASALAVLAALATTGTSLSAQAAPSGSNTEASAFVGMGFVPTALVRPSDGATRTDSAAASIASTKPSPEVVRGPSLSTARVASHAVSTKRGAPAPLIQDKPSNRNSVALMIVGGAALVVGAVIGGDAGTLVMLGGAAVGLYGLYLFLT